ncbi:MAG: OB-fold domain-containing protein [bacterium]|nr:OB-fold domain-containing protein [bacterium]
MSFPAPETNDLNRPYWDGLAAGELRHQHCSNCGNNWLPAREACPRCLATDPVWQPASGRGRIVSWVVYHKAYHNAFADRVPYDVSLVELDEGPRLLTNIVDSDAGRALSIGALVELKIEREGDLTLARFRLVSDEGTA